MFNKIHRRCKITKRASKNITRRHILSGRSECLPQVYETCRYMLVYTLLAFWPTRPRLWIKNLSTGNSSSTEAAGNKNALCCVCSLCARSVRFMLFLMELALQKKCSLRLSRWLSECFMSVLVVNHRRREHQLIAWNIIVSVNCFGWCSVQRASLSPQPAWRDENVFRDSFSGEVSSMCLPL